LTSHLSGLETCFKTVEAEKTGAVDLHLWTLSLIEEKGSVEKIVSDFLFSFGPINYKLDSGYENQKQEQHCQSLGSNDGLGDKF
jgi:hypothetical protein